MDILNFRYTQEIDVTIRRSFASANIFFKSNGKTIFKMNYRPYFQEMIFHYSFFDNKDYCLDINYVKATAKDGSAFIARTYVNGIFYAIRKKKKKPQIVFMRSGDNGFKNYQLGKDVMDAVCFYNGAVSKDQELLSDFFKKREAKEFDEEKYINSLDDEDKKDYLDNKKIEEIVKQVGKENKLEPDKLEHLIMFIECLPDGDETKQKVLKGNSIEEITNLLLPLLNKAKRYYESVDLDSSLNIELKDNEYTIDNKYIFSRDNFDLIDFGLNDNEMMAYELIYFFEDEYEQIKDYLNKGIERVKKQLMKCYLILFNFVELDKRRMICLVIQNKSSL